MRIALGVEYAGEHYHGWQYQDNVPSVQSHLEHGLSRVAAESVRVVCAGRTDRAVHALSQVVHFDTDAVRDLKAWVWGTNSYLPDDISVRWVKVMPDHFHARFSALNRRYYYVIYNHALSPAIMRSKVSWQYRPLDVEKMQMAANYLLGEQDFTSFRAAQCQAKHPVRTLHRCHLWRKGCYLFMDIQANGFLHHMVRNIAGTLMTVGTGQEAPSWVKTVLDAKDRKLASMTAPPQGLYFAEVQYRPEFGLEQMPVNLPWFLSAQ